jgi:hypothetical protein
VLSGPGDEERREPRADVLRDHFRGAILGVETCAHGARSAAAGPDSRNDTRAKVRPVEHGLAARKLDQGEDRIDAGDFGFDAPGGDVGDDRNCGS